MQRDPRLDPRPGDVVKSSHRIYLVTTVGHGDVWFAMGGQQSATLKFTTIEEWVKWSTDDEVLYVASE